MGSKCSILNDTEHDVWITHGIHWQVAITAVSAAITLITGGMALAGFLASLGVGGALLSGGAMILAEEGVVIGMTAATTTFARLTAAQWSIASFVVGISDVVLAQILKIPQKKAEKLQQKIKDFQASAKLIKPGEKYTWSGTLSLVKKVYVMNDKLQCDKRGCFTGPTKDSENIYPISEYFKNLDVKKKPEDSITVYSRK